MEDSPKNEQETILPSLRVQGTTQHQDTMSLQDDLLNDDQTDDQDAYSSDPDCKQIQVPHIERTLTEESAGILESKSDFYGLVEGISHKFDISTDTGYFQSTLNQPSPACSIQHSDNDDLYQQIMNEVMLNAPSLSAPDSDFQTTNDNNYNPLEKDGSLNRTHRRSYMLAIRRESSRGMIIKKK